MGLKKDLKSLQNILDKIKVNIAAMSLRKIL